MTSCQKVMGWEFGNFKNKFNEIWRRAGPGRAGPGRAGGLTVGDVGTVSIVKIVCLSLLVSKN